MYEPQFLTNDMRFHKPKPMKRLVIELHHMWQPQKMEIEISGRIDSRQR